MVMGMYMFELKQQICEGLYGNNSLEVWGSVRVSRALDVALVLVFIKITQEKLTEKVRNNLCTF